MKISLHWLRELCDLPTLSPEEIGEKITLHTAELEEVIAVAQNFDQVVAGKLSKTTPHANSDKLSIGQFDCGSHGKKQILYGQVHPLTVGEIYPIALAGATLPTGQTIEENTIAGEPSQGMVCDNSELGMKNGELLTFKTKDLGKTLPEICPGFGDHLFDIDNKSLTHRPDLMGHRGFAREYSAIFDVNKKSADFSTVTQTLKTVDQKSALDVDIQTSNCRRFMATQVNDITVQTSDISDMVRLENLGTRAISNIVDITNLVMLEHGQPMHAFDADKVEGSIIIRQAKPGEILVALDDNEYELTADDIVIADETKVLSIAGIMGGLESAVTNTTTNIVFESANFDPAVIRKTSARLGLRSESSMRFEKSLDPANCQTGLYAALAHTITAQPTAKISASTDAYPAPAATKTIRLSLAKVRKLSGINLSASDIERILTALEFQIVKKHVPATEPGSADPRSKSRTSFFEVQIPSFRATKDVDIAEDLIEEIVRMHGFTNIPEILPTLPLTPPKVNKLRQLEWKIRGFLAAKGNLEVYHTSFVSPADQAFIERTDHIAMLNATNEETKYLRQTLLSNLMRSLEAELRTHKALDFFEIGKTYHAPMQEIKRLGFIKAAFNTKSETLFYELKGLVTELLQDLNLPEMTITPSATPSPLAHPHQSAELSINGEKIGEIFTVFPLKNEIKKSQIVFCELNLETILSLTTQQTTSYKKIAEFPSSMRDLSIVIPEKVLIADLIAIAKKSADFLIKMELFDEYRDEAKLGPDLKNLAFHLNFQSPTHTLSHEDTDAQFTQIATQLHQAFEAELRIDFDAKKV